MFDQPLNPNSNQNSQPQPPMAGAGSPMPKREMFDEPEDILGDVDRIQPAKPQVPRPTVSAFGTKPSPILNPLAATPAMPMEKKSSGLGFLANWKKILVVIVGIVVVGGFLSAAGYYAFSFISNLTASKQPVVNVNQNTNASVPVNVNTNAGVVDQTPTQPSVVDTQPEVAVDTDKDGLLDSEERLYGTDITKADTDNDGLTDRDEVKVFKTDPNNPDTDGDTYIDGKEVLSGYDPKGPGKLLKIPTEE